MLAKASAGRHVAATDKYLVKEKKLKEKAEARKLREDNADREKAPFPPVLLSMGQGWIRGRDA